VLAALLLLTSAARGQSEPAEPAARGGNGQLQLALTDAVSFGAVTSGYFIGREGVAHVPGFLWAVGGAGYFLGGPIVHMGNEEYGLAGVSFAMRLLFPVVGAAIGGHTSICPPEEWLCGREGAAEGFALGAATAAIADNALTALVKASRTEPPNASPHRAAPISVRLLPALVAAPNVAMFGVGGRF